MPENQEKINSLIAQIESWSGRSIGDLYSLILDLEEATGFAGIPLELYELETARPIPHEVRHYPVWSIDTADICLVGELDELRTEPLSSVLEACEQ